MNEIVKGKEFFPPGYIYLPYKIKLIIPYYYEGKRLPRKFKKKLKKEGKKAQKNPFRPSLDIIDRYAEKLVNNKFYGKVLIPSEERKLCIKPDGCAQIIITPTIL